MAQVPYNPVAEVAPDVRSPDDYLRVQSSPDMFGGLLARGLEQAGAGASKASQFFGQVAADDASNNFQDFANKLLHGDPSKTITGPDGQPQQDTGYLGLKGRAALDARPNIESQLDEYLKSTRSGLTSAEQQLQFDNFSRRYRSYVAGQIGTHADDQSQLWFQQVNKSSSDLALQHIAADPDNPAIQQLLEVCYQTHLATHRALIKAGADFTSVGDSPAGPDVVSPAMFGRYARPYEERLVRELAAEKIFTLIHICGNTTSILDQLAQYPYCGFELDYKTDVRQAKAIVGAQHVLFGNVDPSGVIACGTPEQVREATRWLIAEWKPGGRFILNAGCAIPASTPRVNMAAFMSAAREFGSYN